MEGKYLTPLEAIDAARKITPIYLGGSRQMHKLSGDEEHIAQAKKYANDFSLAFKDLWDEEQNAVQITIPITDETDYDFYATYSPEIESFLLDYGFQQTDFVKGMEDNGSYSLDEEALTILERDDVQIVLRNDAEFYRDVFDNIEPWFYKNYLWKSSGEPTVVRENIQLIFNMLFDIARAAKGAK